MANEKYTRAAEAINKIVSGGNLEGAADYLENCVNSYVEKETSSLQDEIKRRDKEIEDRINALSKRYLGWYPGLRAKSIG